MRTMNKYRVKPRYMRLLFGEDFIALRKHSQWVKGSHPQFSAIGRDYVCCEVNLYVYVK
jgi:hypothetical protein